VARVLARTPTGGSIVKRFVKIAAVTGAVAYLRDPERRGAMLGRLKGLAAQGGESVSQAGRAVGAQAQDVVEKASALRDGGATDDVTLARKVETEIFRDADSPKGAVDVNVQDGVVQLRGELEPPELIEELVEKARKVDGVRGVENLLHAPGTPAPMHQ
jgi:hypothetical protein